MTYKKKLIEVALPLAKINEESAREKSIRQGHPSTLHLWWARRPLAAARAVLWASLVDDPSAHPDLFPTFEAQQVERRRLLEILERLVPWEASTDDRVLAEAFAEIRRSCDGELPRVLDPFGGGGAIPLEALRLGLPAYTGDLNPVAVLIQRAMLEIPSRFAGRPPVNASVRSGQAVWEGSRGLAADVEGYGEWMRARALDRIGRLYPSIAGPGGERLTPIAWIWARTVKSPDPSWPGHVPLVRSWLLAKKPGLPVQWIEPEIDRAGQTIAYRIRTGGAVPDGTVNRQGATCIATGASIPLSYVRAEAQAGRMGAVLLAVVADSVAGRIYIEASQNEMPLDIPDASAFPAGPIFDWPGRTNVVRYGLDEWWKLFTPRQLVALDTYSSLIAEVRAVIVHDALESGLSDSSVRLRDGGNGAQAYADAVVTYLVVRR